MVVIVVVRVVVFVTIEREGAARAGPEQRAVFRGRGDVFGRAFAADVAVQADDPVGRRHDHMQVMADEKDGASGVAADLFDEAVEGSLSGLV